MADVLLRARGITKTYPQGSGELQILRGVDLEVRQGEAIGIVGASGAGKSTLLQILGTLDRPTSGELFFEEKNLLALDDRDLSRFRSRKMGFVFQFHHLMAEFTALENVLLPCRIGGEIMSAAKRRAEERLELLGLKDRMDHYPSQLSGGELQRVAIARALIREPQILFADEPTGNLDSTNSARIQNLFFELAQTLGLTVIVVTHDRAFASRFPRLLEMKDGLWRS